MVATHHERSDQDEKRGHVFTDRANCGGCDILACHYYYLFREQSCSHRDSTSIGHWKRLGMDDTSHLRVDCGWDPKI